MGTIINFELRNYNERMSKQFRDDANERNAELFFAIGVSVGSKDMQLFYNNAGGVERVIETMEHALQALKISEAKKRK